MKDPWSLTKSGIARISSKTIRLPISQFSSLLLQGAGLSSVSFPATRATVRVFIPRCRLRVSSVQLMREVRIAHRDQPAFLVSAAVMNPGPSAQIPDSELQGMGFKLESGIKCIHDGLSRLAMTFRKKWGLRLTLKVSCSNQIAQLIFYVARNHRVRAEYPDRGCGLQGRLQPHSANLSVAKFDVQAPQPP